VRRISFVCGRDFVGLADEGGVEIRAHFASDEWGNDVADDLFLCSDGEGVSARVEGRMLLIWVIHGLMDDGDLIAAIDSSGRAVFEANSDDAGGAFTRKNL